MVLKLNRFDFGGTNRQGNRQIDHIFTNFTVAGFQKLI